MSNITLTWNADGSIESFSVYRAEQTIDTSNLPPPIATGIKDKTYIDNNVVDDKTYFYRVASVKGGQQKISDEVSLKTASSSAKLTFVSSANIDNDSGASAVNLSLPTHQVGDILILICRSYNQEVSSSGFKKIYNDKGYFWFLAKIATQVQSSISIMMGSGAVVLAVLRPDNKVLDYSATANSIQYTATAVSDNSIKRELYTPELVAQNSGFELNGMEFLV